MFSVGSYDSRDCESTCVPVHEAQVNSGRDRLSLPIIWGRNMRGVEGCTCTSHILLWRSPCWEQWYVRYIHLTWFSWSSTLYNIFSMIHVPWSIKYARKLFLYFPCEMDFSPLVFESHPRRKWLLWDLERLVWEKAAHMEKHTKCIIILASISTTLRERNDNMV